MGEPLNKPLNKRYVRFPLWISGVCHTAMVSRTQVDTWDVCKLLKDAFPFVIDSWTGAEGALGRVAPGDEIVIAISDAGIAADRERDTALAWAEQAFAAFGCVLTRKGRAGGNGTYQWVFALREEAAESASFDPRVEMT
jgi:hypothetical protein